MIGCLIHGAAPCSFPFGPPRHSGMHAWRADPESRGLSRLSDSGLDASRRPGMTNNYPWMACHTRSGVAGISSRLLPIASVMALMTAADAPIAPASPQPLTPSGLPGHSVVVWSNLNDGRWWGRGMARPLQDTANLWPLLSDTAPSTVR